MLPDDVKSFILKCAQAGWVDEARLSEVEGDGSDSVAQTRFTPKGASALFSIGAAVRDLGREQPLSPAECFVLLFYAQKFSAAFPPKAKESPPDNEPPRRF